MTQQFSEFFKVFRISVDNAITILLKNILLYENNQHGHENTCMIKGTKMCQVSNHSTMSLKYG